MLADWDGTSDLSSSSATADLEPLHGASRPWLTATVRGYHRRFCLWRKVKTAAPENPGWYWHWIAAVPAAACVSHRGERCAQGACPAWRRGMFGGNITPAGSTRTPRTDPGAPSVGDLITGPALTRRSRLMRSLLESSPPVAALRVRRRLSLPDRRCAACGNLTTSTDRLCDLSRHARPLIVAAGNDCGCVCPVNNPLDCCVAAAGSDNQSSRAGTAAHVLAPPVDDRASRVAERLPAKGKTMGWFDGVWVPLNSQWWWWTAGHDGNLIGGLDPAGRRRRRLLDMLRMRGLGQQADSWQGTGKICRSNGGRPR